VEEEEAAVEAVVEEVVEADHQAQSSLLDT
jgi:hypothetical protein